MRAIWKGAVAFGLVNVPVRLYAATGEHSVAMHQVHESDGGRIRYRKVCAIDGEEVPADQIVKGVETDDGRMVVLSDEDLDSLPLAASREIAVQGFVPEAQVEPITLGRTYYLEPEAATVKPYVLLREALASTERVALVTVALRQRESMAVLRVRGDVICLQTLLWPDEVRDAAFDVLETEVDLKDAERTMASSLVESMAMDLDPSAFTDHYAEALETVIAQKVSEGGAVPIGGEPEESGGDVVDLLSALQRSVAKARAARGEDAGPAGGCPDGAAGAEDAEPAPAKNPRAKKPSRRRAS